MGLTHRALGSNATAGVTEALTERILALFILAVHVAATDPHHPGVNTSFETVRVLAANTQAVQWTSADAIPCEAVEPAWREVNPSRYIKGTGLVLVQLTCLCRGTPFVHIACVVALDDPGSDLVYRPQNGFHKMSASYGDQGTYDQDK